MTLDTLVQSQEDGMQLEETASHYAEVANRKGKLIERIKKAGDEYGIPLLESVDLRNEGQLAQYGALVSEAARKRAIHELKKEGSAILDEIPEDKLAASALKIPPSKTGNKEHDEIAELQEKNVKYHALNEKLNKKEIDYEAFSKTLAQDVKKDIEERIKDIDWMDKELRENIVKTIIYSIENSPQSGLSVMAYYIDRNNAKIEEYLPKEDTKRRAEYTRNNILKLVESGKDEDLQKAGTLIYLINREDKSGREAA